MKRLLGMAAVVFALSTLVVAPATAEFEVEILGTLATGEGELSVIRAVEINHRGQVVGTAHPGPGDGTPGFAAFRFTPGTGMENMDPEGGASSFGDRINRRGHVFGHEFHRRTLFGRTFLFTAIRHRNKLRKDRVMAAFATFEGTSDLTSSVIIKADVTVENGKDKRAKGRLYDLTLGCFNIGKFEAVNPDLVP